MKEERELLVNFETALSGILKQPRVQAHLAAFGYDADDLEADRKLLLETLGACRLTGEEIFAAKSAERAVTRADQAAALALKQLQRVIQMADRHDETLALAERLELREELPTDPMTLMAYGQGLLERIRADSEARDALAPLGVDGERLSELRVTVGTVGAAERLEARHTERAEETRVVYEELIAQSRTAYRVLEHLARRALAEHPPLLASLGLSPSQKGSPGEGDE
jgi:hypothetical protein